MSVGLKVASGGLMLRDRVRGVTRGLRRHKAAEVYFFPSGKRRLACAYVPGRQGGPYVLLCHGIGETIQHWCAVQALLADHGVGSLVFNYSGYGRSSGRVRAEHCDEDLVAAYAELRRRAGEEAPVFVLGFSLGSGIAAQGASLLEPAVSGLFLCEGFDSFRNAAHAVGVPRCLTFAVPDVWTTLVAMQTVPMPVWIVHSEADRLFPMAMAQRIQQACGTRGELVEVRGFSHNDLYLTAPEGYWALILDRIHGQDSRSGAAAGRVRGPMQYESGSPVTGR